MLLTCWPDHLCFDDDPTRRSDVCMLQNSTILANESALTCVYDSAEELGCPGCDFDGMFCRVTGLWQRDA
ncbi:hypothetical protein NECAME_17040 [Necator americanus]|uniref:Uncharacterized protein n=1 Tax=Necator americanus TaxID=51031 RepID=W2TUG4_NECAM|nr:hypothetical protein NECAME_17040 [Necator americanus]ETN84692.1 hypothetical protein NECAME_17040 [Necator americanus]